MRKRSTSLDFPTAESPSRMIFTAPFEVTCVPMQQNMVSWGDDGVARVSNERNFRHKSATHKPEPSIWKVKCEVKSLVFSPRKVRHPLSALYHPPFHSGPAFIMGGDVVEKSGQKVKRRDQLGTLPTRSRASSRGTLNWIDKIAPKAQGSEALRRNSTPGDAV